MSWTQPGQGFFKDKNLIKEDMLLMDLKPKHFDALHKELRKIEKRAGFSTLEDGESSLYITDIKNQGKAVKAIEDTLKKLRIREPQDVDFRRNA
tara:strand:- start:651 stop:932 length:282 start_codon:yes stop_codon:yes gene_type:complete